MKKGLKIYLYSLMALCASVLDSCKKDLLHYQNVQKIEGNTTDRLNSILFINDSTGFIAGGERFASSTILVTKDGGYTWTGMGFPEAGKELFDISRAPGGNFYTCGYDGKFLYSTDGGQQWTFKQLMFNPYKKVVFTTADKGMLVGGISFETGYLTHINATGDVTSSDSLGYELNDIKMINGHTGYISGYGVVMRTDDGGATWQLQNIRGDNFVSIAYFQNNIWVCGYNGSVFHTTDGGQTWEKQRNGNDPTQASYHLQAILFKDAMNGWAVGEKGAVIHTDDGGKHWMSYDNFTPNDLRSLAFAPNGDIIVAGDHGTIFRLKP